MNTLRPETQTLHRKHPQPEPQSKPIAAVGADLEVPIYRPREHGQIFELSPLLSSTGFYTSQIEGF